MKFRGAATPAQWVAVALRNSPKRPSFALRTRTLNAQWVVRVEVYVTLASFETHTVD